MNYGKYKWCVKLEAYWEGVDAGVEKAPVESNPYPGGTKNWIAWRAGYLGV